MSLLRTKSSNITVKQVQSEPTSGISKPGKSAVPLSSDLFLVFEKKFL